MRIRPYAPDDRTDVLRLAARLTEGVAPWRDAQRVAAAVREAAVERRGTGRALLAAAEAWAARRGLTTVTLETGAANGSARAFYARCGYLEEDVRLTRPLAPRTSQSGRGSGRPGSA